MNFTGLIIGASVFLLIGMFHPIVIKVEYYLGKQFWWMFAVIGVLALVASIFISNDILSSIIGALGITCFWSIKELFEQEERVKKGWFPKNPQKK